MTQTINCPVCGSEQRLSNSSIYSLRCSNCESSLINKNGTFSSDGSNIAQKIPPPKTKLSLGMTGKFGQLGESMIVGRVCYANGRDIWSEWLMLTSSGSYFWLIEDDESFSLMRKFTPTTPFNPMEINPSNRIRFGNLFLEIEERGTSEVIGFEGELIWKACAGDRMNFIDGYTELGHEETLYSIEWSDSEIVFYTGQEIRTSNVYTIFGLPIEGLSHRGSHGSGSGFMGSFWGQFLIYCILLFLVSLVSCSIIESSGEPVSATGYNQEDPTAGTITYGPYVLEQTSKTVHINLKTSLYDNEVEGDIIILNKDKQDVKEFPFRLYHESGEESDSSKLSIDQYYTLKDSGLYYIKVISAPENMALMKNIKIIVSQGCRNPEPFSYLAILCSIPLGLAIILLIIKNQSDEDD